MKTLKIAFGLIMILSCGGTTVLYYWYRYTLIIAFEPTESVLEDTTEETRAISSQRRQIEEIFRVKLVDTIGCKIPIATVNYSKLIKNDTQNVTCGKRAVFLAKYNDNMVKASINEEELKEYLKHKDNYFDCCYQFLLKIVPTTPLSSDDHNVIFSNCTKFKDKSKITLQTDYIKIKCYEYNSRNQSNIIYDDMFAFVKKVFVPRTKCKTKYNLLMIGMDSMSLPRAAQLLPKTVNLLEDEYWVSLRGYHKVAENTFSNLMAAFTGKNLTSIEDDCSKNMDNCKDFMIWEDFRQAGYITAYGEDYQQLGDTFKYPYAFQKPPTHHYMKPLFKEGEHKLNNSMQYLCTGKVCSGQQILDYAIDFTNTYRNDLHFGLFWINSFSHHASSNLREADKLLEYFLERLTKNDILSNTFVIFFSSNGILFGKHRVQVETYYDERLPMFFMWLPLKFRKTHPFEVQSVGMNQFRLVTPYDIYSTLLHIKEISICSNITDTVSESCPKCHSVFEIISSKRTCQDASISEKWCSCHKMFPLSVNEIDSKEIVKIVVTYMRSKLEAIKTRTCWRCRDIYLNKVIRIHFYYAADNATVYYVVAFSLFPGNAVYEATVVQKGEDPGIVLDTVSILNSNKNIGSCVINPQDRQFCICQKTDIC